MKLGLLSCIVLLASTSVWAQTRTTPVEVKNTPSVTVEGTPNVSVTNTPSVTVSGTPNVNVANTPAVTVNGTPNVSVINTPNMNVANVPSVSINPSANTIKSPTLHSTVRLWSSQSYISPGSSIQADINCAGYKEMRVVLPMNQSPIGSDKTLIQVVIWSQGEDNNWSILGTANFASTTQGLTNQANFVSYSSTCSFNIPVVNDMMRIQIKNNLSSGNIGISSGSSAYLVN